MEHQHRIAERLVADIRAALANKGDIGLWLLDAIDDALESGLEAQEAEVRYQMGFSGQPSKHGGRSGVIYRRPQDMWEVLNVHLNVLEAYMVVLPACFEKAEISMREEFGVEGVRISTLMEFAPEIIFDEQTVHEREDIAPQGWRDNIEMFQHIRELIQELQS